MHFQCFLGFLVSASRGGEAPIIATPHFYEFYFIYFIYYSYFFVVSPSSEIIVHFIAAPAP